MNEDNPSVEDLIPGAYKDVPEIISEVFHRMPWGVEFTLANGRRGRLVAVSKQPSTNQDGRWRFAFDARFDEGSPDHIEFTVTHTGGGGFVGDVPDDMLPEAEPTP